MTESDQLLKNRFSELAHRAFARGCYAYSEFLTMAEQDILACMPFDQSAAPFSLQGGYGGAERRIACFGSEELCGYPETSPIACLHITPVSQKFADTLTHRDFLGSLMALGFRRNLLGDIIISDNAAYLFCLESIAPYITDQFDKVRHTCVRCAVTEDTAPAAALPEPIRVNVASERLDAVIAAVYRLSRSESQQLFVQRKVFVDGRLTENTSFSPAAGHIVSVRGFGRFLYEGIERETKKGRLFISVRVF